MPKFEIINDTLDTYEVVQKNSNIHYYVNEKLLKHFDISNEYLWQHIPKVIRLLKAERIVISQYQSPDLLEVGYYSCGFLLIVYF